MHHEAALPTEARIPDALLTEARPDMEISTEICQEPDPIMVEESDDAAVVPEAHSDAALCTETHHDVEQPAEARPEAALLKEAPSVAVTHDDTRRPAVSQPAALHTKVRHQEHSRPWKKTHRGCRGGRKKKRKQEISNSQPCLRAANQKQARPSTANQKEARPIAARRQNERSIINDKTGTSAHREARLTAAQRSRFNFTKTDMPRKQ